MVEDDTIKLLRECVAGIEMGIESLDQVIDETEDDGLRHLLVHSKDDHLELKKKAEKYLDKYHDEGKQPAAIAQLMSKLKTQFKLMTNHTDAEIADLMTEGCNMGVKSLNQYLNQYPAANMEVKKLVGELILEEEQLERKLRPYL